MWRRLLVPFRLASPWCVDARRVAAWMRLSIQPFSCCRDCFSRNAAWFSCPCLGPAAHGVEELVCLLVVERIQALIVEPCLLEAIEAQKRLPLVFDGSRIVGLQLEGRLVCRERAIVLAVLAPGIADVCVRFVHARIVTHRFFHCAQRVFVCELRTGAGFIATACVSRSGGILLEAGCALDEGIPRPVGFARRRTVLRFGLELSRAIAWWAVGAYQR